MLKFVRITSWILILLHGISIEVAATPVVAGKRPKMEILEQRPKTMNKEESFECGELYDDFHTASFMCYSDYTKCRCAYAVETISVDRMMCDLIYYICLIGPLSTQRD